MNRLNNHHLCKKAEVYYYDFVCDESHRSVPENVIGHIEQCQICQHQINQLKEALLQMEGQGGSKQKQTRAAVNKWLELHLSYIGKRVTCGAVRPFLPGLLDTEVEIKIPTPITAHLDKCRECRKDLESIQKLNLNRDQLWQLGQILTGEMSEDLSVEPAKPQYLQKIASQIAERPESGIVTIYHLDETAKAEVSSESNDIYAGFPIRVEAVDSDDGTDKNRMPSVISISALLKRKIPAINYKSLLKPTIVAAAVLIAFTLLINVPTAGATTLEQIYKAIDKIKNVYIAKFSPEKEEPKQEMWVSREFNIYMAKVGSEMALWDIGNGLRKTKSSITNTIETNQLTEGSITGIEKKISGYLGLVPFGSMSDIPVNHSWDDVTGKYPQAAAEGLEVYELTWVSKKYSGFDEFWKWRVYLESKTKLPHRVEWYHKLAADEKYVLQDIIEVEYLSGSEIQTVLKSGGF